jgi:hypothetical protein
MKRILVLCSVAAWLFAAGCGSDDSSENKDAGATASDTAGGGTVDPGASTADKGSSSVDPGAASTDKGTASTDPGTASTDPGTASTGGFAPAGMPAGDLELKEGGAQGNVWTFDGSGGGTAGNATLTGAGEFPYTYEKTGDNTATLKLDVGGEDRYDLTYTSATGGTFEESFDGGPGTTGEFTFTAK